MSVSKSNIKSFRKYYLHIYGVNDFTDNNNSLKKYFRFRGKVEPTPQQRCRKNIGSLSKYFVQPMNNKILIANPIEISRAHTSKTVAH